MRNRLDSDRRCYALFHPRMPEEPLAFVEVALVQGMAGSLQALLDQQAPQMDSRHADTAISDSLSSTKNGQKQNYFGDYLSKPAVQTLSREFQRLTVVAYLCNIPAFPH